MFGVQDSWFIVCGLWVGVGLGGGGSVVSVVCVGRVCGGIG